MTSNEKLIARVTVLHKKNKSLVARNKMRKRANKELERQNEELAKEENDQSGKVEELLKFKEQYNNMKETAEKVQAIGYSYAGLIMELTQEVVLRGGDSAPYLEKLNKISGGKKAFEM